MNSRLLVVNFWGSQDLYEDFQLCKGSAPLTPHCSRVNCTVKTVASGVVCGGEGVSWLLVFSAIELSVIAWLVVTMKEIQDIAWKAPERAAH